MVKSVVFDCWFDMDTDSQLMAIAIIFFLWWSFGSVRRFQTLACNVTSSRMNVNPRTNRSAEPEDARSDKQQPKRIMKNGTVWAWLKLGLYWKPVHRFSKVVFFIGANDVCLVSQVTKSNIKAECKLAKVVSRAVICSIPMWCKDVADSRCWLLNC